MLIWYSSTAQPSAGLRFWLASPGKSAFLQVLEKVELVLKRKKCFRRGSYSRNPGNIE